MYIMVPEAIELEMLKYRETIIVNYTLYISFKYGKSEKSE